MPALKNSSPFEATMSHENPPRPDSLPPAADPSSLAAAQSPARTALAPVPDPSEEILAADYHAVSGLALVGLLLGLGSAAVVVSAYLWMIPVAGIVVSVLALQRIAQEKPVLIGRKAALVGLFLSVMFLVEDVTDCWGVHPWMLHREARQFGLAWFEQLKQNQPQKAHQLTQSPSRRQKFGEKLWDYYTANYVSYSELKDYVARPLIRTLLALGPKAEVRYYATQDEYEQYDSTYVEQIYAVTCREGPSPATFFVSLTLQRSTQNRGRESGWQVYDSSGPVTPVDMGGDTHRQKQVVK
jgi:hypothetical protein